MSMLLRQARVFAIQAHGSQRYGTHPYVYHLDQVVDYVAAYGEVAQVIAYLHDVVEDTTVHIERIAHEFGEKVAYCVGLISDEPGETRQIRKAKTYARLALVNESGYLALIVKAADRLANVRMCMREHEAALLATYVAEHPQFYTSAYRQSLCDELWQPLNRTIEDAKLVLV